jgi:hypothetical protein
LVAEFVIDDAASLETLALACEARARARRCRIKINENETGEVVTDRWGQLQRHPLLTSEAHAHGVFLSAMRQLRLDVTGEGNK